MDWTRTHLRKLRWQLTLSYTAVTVISLLVIAAVAAMILFSKVLLPNRALTPQNWIDIARQQSQAYYGELLSATTDPAAYTRLIQVFDPTIVINSLFLFKDMEVFVRTTGDIDLLIADKDRRLLAVSNRSVMPFLQGAKLGESFDPGLVPDLAGPFNAALQGRTSAEAILHEFDTGDGFLMAIPIFNPDQWSEVVGVVVYYIHDISTEADRGAYFAIVLLRSLVVILIAAVMVGTTFGAITAEGLAGRFRRFVSASEAWSKGDFSPRIQADSQDEIGALAERLDGMAEDLQELVDNRQRLAINEERNRLGRELHDSAKQLALAASFQIATARQLFERDPQAAAASLVEAERLIDKVRSELTDLIHELRSSQLDSRDLAEIIQTFTSGWAHSSEIEVQLNLQPLEDLPLETEETLYRILQEALANVSRHSQASHVSIELQQLDGEIQLSVRDDGVGFVEPPSQGVGLASMRERAEAIGGFTRITGQAGRGTEVRTILPIPKKDLAGFRDPAAGYNQGVEDDRNHSRDAG